MTRWPVAASIADDRRCRIAGDLAFGARPARRDMGRLSERKLADEKCGYEREHDDRQPCDEDGMQGIREPMADAGRDCGRHTRQLSGIKDGPCVGSAS
jgi:hypothetical protein